MSWTTVCALAAVPKDGAVAVLVDGAQVAVVRLGDDSLFAVSHRDPVSGANVMARGIVGSTTVDGVEVPTIASPMFKQVYDLRDGRCLSDRLVVLATWEVRLHGDDVEVGSIRVVTASAADADVPIDSEVAR
ncbi:nitrite reductase small subunit NirD [Flexivirga alba]|uniref:Nitrite reductase small subunit NirD n=1 Tax=Flexivirga alba TaxID=702742 RepID=A0ABW2AF21_9MICO